VSRTAPDNDATAAGAEITRLAAPASPADYVRDFDMRMLVGGDLCAAAGGEIRPTIDPSTGEPVAEVPEAGAADVARAVDAAAAAQPAWEAAALAERCEAVLRLAAAVEARRDAFAMLDAIDSGNPLAAMENDVRLALEQMHRWPALVRWQPGRTFPASPTGLHYAAPKPYGVVGKILPYNHPALFLLTRILAPLLAGNAVVVKPAWQTPLTALLFAGVARDVLPPGVINVVTGGTEPGDALVRHPRVKRISFIGSVPVGRLIQRGAAEAGVKTVTLELGGKNPMIVFPDADLGAAVRGAIVGMNFGVCQGQSCGSNSRVYVHRAVEQEFVARAAAELEAMTVGPAYVPGVDMGPLITEEHRARVLGYIDSGRSEGARLVTGGGRPAGDAPAGGHFVEPTLFADVGQRMTIAREEIFGPVMSVLPWDDYEQVIGDANDTEFGLTASVWTNDLTLAHRTAERLQAGYVWINDAGTHYWGTPFGGMKSSGVGREEALDEYESYREMKVIHTVLGDPAAALRGMGVR
jgi:betaine-aldehyde dehydrogenase